MWVIAVCQLVGLVLSLHEKRAKGLLRPIKRRKRKTEQPTISVTSMP